MYPTNTHKHMRDYMIAAEKFPLPVRIAAAFLRTGAGESDWIALSGELSDLSQVMFVKIHNAIRDIERGAYRLEDIPKP